MKGWSCMESTFVLEMENSLRLMKDNLIKNLISENQDFKEIVKDMGHPDLADTATDDIDRKLLETLSAQDVKTLRLIDSALSRIKNNLYGKCMSCGKKIPEERLKAIPYTMLCISCKSSDERKKR